MAKNLKHEEESAKVPASQMTVDPNKASMSSMLGMMLQNKDLGSDLLKLEKAKDTELEAIEQGFVKLEKVGDVFIGAFAGTGVLDRQEGEPINQLYFAARDAKTGELVPKVMNATTVLESLFAAIRPGTPVKVVLTNIEKKGTQGATLKHFTVQALK